MSTVIPAGHEILGHNLESLLEHLHAFRPQLVEVARNQAKTFIGRLATFYADCAALGVTDDDEADNPGRGRSPALRAYRAMVDRQEKLAERHLRDPVTDFSFELTVFPVENRIFGKYFAENRELIQFWRKQLFIRDFGYDDRGDRPERITATEWAERGRIWDKVFANHPTTGHAGYSITLVTAVDCLSGTASDLGAFRPDRKTRAGMLANSLPPPADLVLDESLSRREKEAKIHAYWLARLPRKPSVKMLTTCMPA